MNNKIRLEERVKSEIFARQYHKQQSPGKSSPGSSSSTSQQQFLAPQSHKRQESDSKLSLNFVRGFRRENSDFFPMSKRHSAILGEQIIPGGGGVGSKQMSSSAIQQQQRSSAIFSRNRNKGEPILTDFTVTKRGDGDEPRPRTPPRPTGSGSSNHPTPRQGTTPSVRNLDFLRPRREKTESVIFVRNSPTRQHLFDSQVKRFLPYPFCNARFPWQVKHGRLTRVWVPGSSNPITKREIGYEARCRAKKLVWMRWKLGPNLEPLVCYQLYGSSVK